MGSSCTDNVKQALLEKCKSGAFKHYISLGYNCFVASDLRKLGLRDSSMPFDWNRTYFKAIEKVIKKETNGFLEYDRLIQSDNYLYVYYDPSFGITFVHDFVDYKPLKNQIKSVKRKYERRLSRFYEHISEPTLFIRYCCDFDDELKYICSHFESIDKSIK